MRRPLLVCTLVWLSGCTLVFGTRRHEGDSDGGVPDGGCATNLLGDPTHCGPSCESNCLDLPHVDPTHTVCEAGNCLANACLPGFGNCTGERYGGCPTDLTTTSNCGGCHVACTGATPYCVANGFTYQCSATADNACFIGATCPATDCAGCGLTCSAQEVCCVGSLSSCTVNADCCAGTLCHSSTSGQSYCDVPAPGDLCTSDAQCAPGNELCHHGACCLPVGSQCPSSGCCDGMLCQETVAGGSEEACCVPLRNACTQVKDCCTSGSTCAGGVCCFASGTMGCTSNLDCCTGSPGCVAGKCL